MVLPNLELNPVVGVGFLFGVTFGGGKRVRLGKRVGLEGGIGRVGGVEPDFLDLLGDVGDGNGVGFGALEGEPD